MIVRSLVLFSAALLHPIPDTYDATLYGNCRIMHTVFYQGGCSACAAFASASSLSMRACLLENEDYIPSPYRLFDCASASCENGTTLRQTGNALMAGIPDVVTSPQQFGLGCDHGRSSNLLLLYGYAVGSVRAMKLDLLLFGPTMVAISGTSEFIRHRQGVFHPRMDESDGEDTRHSVVLVGWGAHPEPHWVILNSWSRRWGEDGKAKVAMHAFRSHYAWRTRSEAVVEGSIALAYFGFLLVLVSICAVFLPDDEVRLEWCRDGGVGGSI
jgi:hypothetical protein